MVHVNVSPAEVRSVLRTVLRAVDRHLTRINGNRQWRQEIIARFRTGSQQPLGNELNASRPRSLSSGGSDSVQPGLKAEPQHFTSAALVGCGLHASSRPIASAGHPPTPAQALALAREWVELVNNIGRHKELLLSYNIGLDVDERTKRMVEATARRVGFALPDSSRE